MWCGDSLRDMQVPTAAAICKEPVATYPDENPPESFS